MVGIKRKRLLQLLLVVALAHTLFACVSTEALYAEYDAADCQLVAKRDAFGAMQLHEQITDTHYPWEPAVYFAYDRSELSKAETDRLDRSLQVLQKFPSLALGLQGFTDGFGSVDYNNRLAKRRVLTVKEYVQNQGIAAHRIFLQPVGKALATSADTQERRHLNRRVELMLVDKDGKPVAVQLALNEE